MERTGRSARSSWIALAYWFAPLVFLLWLYKRSFQIWFRFDDFPLLWFVRQVHGIGDLPHALFAPYAQGTIRPWSERVPFLLSSVLFDTDCLPFRIAVFATVALDLVLLNWVVRRMTGSRVAGAAAAVFWAASAGILSPMTWNSSYNQVQYPAFLLGALALFIRFEETGRKRYWWLQFVVFALGFGSHEGNIVYPAVAVAWCLFVAPPERRSRLLWWTSPLFVVSVVYLLVHRMVAPAPVSGIYAIHVDWRIFQTLWEYWRWAFLPAEWTEFEYHARLGAGILYGSMFVFAGFVAWQIRQRRFAVCFGLAWFLLTLAPVLPLPDRHTEYYLAGPMAALAMVAGWGVASALESGWVARGATLAAAAAWLCGMVLPVRLAAENYVAESKMSRALVLGVQAARQSHPGKAIVLEGITDQLYQIAIFELGFGAVGVEDVHLAPGSEAVIHPIASDHIFAAMILSPQAARQMFLQDHAVVYSMAGNHLRNITAVYAARLAK